MLAHRGSAQGSRWAWPTDTDFVDLWSLVLSAKIGKTGTRTGFGVLRGKRGGQEGRKNQD